MYLWLKARLQNGEIENIRCEERVTILDAPGRDKVQYYVDFVVFDKLAGHDIGIEVKGFETDVWMLKLKLFRIFGPFPLHIYKLRRQQLALQEEVIPKGGKIVYPEGVEP